MPRTGHYLFGLVMFCLAFAFTMGLASFLQQAAMARQQAVVAAQVETMPVISMLQMDGYYRKASF
jgi:drug/metabolite transporter (DMT)-like permease